jgi:hypothetical protein
MRLLGLAGIVFVFGVALPVGVGVIRITAGAVDIPEPTTAKAGVMTAVGRAAITKPRAAAAKAAPLEPAAAMETAEAAATAEPAKTASAVKTAKASTTAEAERTGVVGADRETGDDRRA